jgi:hypothetical protein
MIKTLLIMIKEFVTRGVTDEPMRTTTGGGNRCGLEWQVVGTHFICWGGWSRANVES